MNIIKKDATITSTGEASDFPGTFEVVLSNSALDRDGDTLLPGDWKTPLPDHITFDLDHGMSVATTVGSGVPSLEDGQLIVRGTFSSLDRAQEVRTLVNEGHIRTTSVAFMNEKSTEKGSKGKTVRELLNGAFVAIPSNREAVILSSKSMDDTDVKAGARNNSNDAAAIQSIHDAATGLGAACGTKAATDATTKDGVLPSDDTNPAAIAQAADAALDEALALFAAVDPETLPLEIQQAIGLVQAADSALDEFLEVVGITDPSEEAESASGVDEAPVAGAPAPATGAKSAPVVDDVDSDAVNALAIQLLAAQFTE